MFQREHGSARTLVWPCRPIPQSHANLVQRTAPENFAQNMTRSLLDILFCGDRVNRARAQKPGYIIPSFIRPASLIMLWFHGGSHTSWTSASSTPSIDKILLWASCAIAGPIPQPGAVNVIFTSTLVPPSGALINRQSETRPRSTMFTGISGADHCRRWFHAAPSATPPLAQLPG